MTGNLKFDLRAPAHTSMVDQLQQRLAASARVLVCGSTLEGEEAILLRLWPALVQQVPDAVMVLAPRHPERFAGVERLVRATGLLPQRASKYATTTGTIPSGGIVLLNTIGDLAAVYSLGAAAFVGGSLVSAGGHNPLEPARFAVPVTMGASTYNFREIVETMQAKDAIRVVQKEKLPDVLSRALAGDPAIRAMGERGRTVFEQNAGATGRTVQQLLNVLQASSREIPPA